MESRAKADYQSIEALIKRRNAIKSAIVVSNATTKIEVAGVKMTVAEAIERKTSISYDIQLLDKLKEVYADLVGEAENVNQKVTERLDKHLETLFGKDGKVKAAENQEIVKSFLAENEAKIIDPLNLKEKIDCLSKRSRTLKWKLTLHCPRAIHSPKSPSIDGRLLVNRKPIKLNTFRGKGYSLLLYHQHSQRDAVPILR